MTRPLILHPFEVRGLLAGTIRQIRRPVKPQPLERLHAIWKLHPNQEGSPFGAPGERLVGKETWMRSGFNGNRCHKQAISYQADTDDPNKVNGITWFARPKDEPLSARFMWLSPTTMPDWASRLSLVTLGVRVQRVQEALYDDVVAEGCSVPCEQYSDDSNDTSWFGPSKWFRENWDSHYAKKGYAWDTNCWTWVASVERSK